MLLLIDTLVLLYRWSKLSCIHEYNSQDVALVQIFTQNGNHVKWFRLPKKIDVTHVINRTNRCMTVNDMC